MQRNWCYIRFFFHRHILVLHVAFSYEIIALIYCWIEKGDYKRFIVNRCKRFFKYFPPYLWQYSPTFMPCTRVVSRCDKIRMRLSENKTFEFWRLNSYNSRSRILVDRDFPTLDTAMPYTAISPILTTILLIQNQ